MSIYKYTDATNTVVHVIDEDGKSYRSCRIEALPEGAVILPADAPTATQQVAAIKQKAQEIIFTKWPIWAQQNCADGTYSPADKEQMLVDKGLVLTECVRLVAAIEAGQSAIPNWPII